MIRHTFALESHGLEQAIENVQRALRGMARVLIICESSNGTFITLECEDIQSFAEATLLIGTLLSEHLRHRAFYAVDTSVTFVERTLQPALPTPPPVAIPTSPSPDPRTHPLREGTPR